MSRLNGQLESQHRRLRDPMWSQTQQYLSLVFLTIPAKCGLESQRESISLLHEVSWLLSVQLASRAIVVSSLFVRPDDHRGIQLRTCHGREQGFEVNSDAGNENNREDYTKG